ncbi:autotransporter-associated beta strand repeat-containing protein [Achromobacter insuavis]
MLNGALTLPGSNDLTLAGAVSGAGSLVKNGASTLTLGNANSFGGGVQLNGGTLAVGNNGALGSGTLTTSGGTTLSATAPVTLANAVTLGAGTTTVTGANLGLSGVISGAGAIDKTGAGVLTLTGSNNYGGGTTLAGGTLVVGGSSASAAALTAAAGTTLSGLGNASLTNNVTLGGSVTVNGSDSLTLAGVVDGSGPLVKTGASTLTLNGSNTYTGGTTLASGTLVAGGNTALGSGGLSVTGASTLQAGAPGVALANQVNLGAALTVSGANDLTLACNITGAGSLTKSGAGTLTLSGQNQYSGGTTLAGGTLIGDTHSLTGAIGTATGTSLVFNQATGDDGSFGGAISGGGSLTKNGGGTVTLTGANTYTGGTTINAGTLAGNATSLQGNINIVDGSALIFNQTGADGTYGGNITTTGNNTGTLTKDGSANLTLTGNNTVGGGTTVNGGTLLVNGTLGGGNVTVNAGGSLGGSRTGRHRRHAGQRRTWWRAPGNPISFAQNLNLSTGTQLDFTLGAPNSATTAVTVGQNLALNGILNIYDGGNLGTGVYRLFSYGGTMTGAGLTYGVLPSGYTSANLTLQNQSNQVNLVLQSQPGEILFWNGAKTTPDGVIAGGSGTWNAAGNNWTDASGNLASNWNGKYAAFSGASGTVTIDGSQAVTGVQFLTSGYTLAAGAGGQLQHRPGADPVPGRGRRHRHHRGADHRRGRHRERQRRHADPGRQQHLHRQHLDPQRRAAGDPGQPAGQWRRDLAERRHAAHRRCRLHHHRPDDLARRHRRRPGHRRGQPDVHAEPVHQRHRRAAQAGRRHPVLNGVNAYAGGTVIAGGTLEGNSASVKGNVSTSAGTTLRMNQGADGAMTGGISGGGQLVKDGAGALTLTQPSTYTGGTRINAGTLIGDTSSLQGAITNNATLVFNQDRTAISRGRSRAPALSSSKAAARSAWADRRPSMAPSRSTAARCNWAAPRRRPPARRRTGQQRRHPVRLRHHRQPDQRRHRGQRLGRGRREPGQQQLQQRRGRHAGGRRRSERRPQRARDRHRRPRRHAEGDQQRPLTGNDTFTVLTADQGRQGVFASTVLPQLAFVDAAVGYDPNNVTVSFTRNQTGFGSVAQTPNQRAVAGAWAASTPTRRCMAPCWADRRRGRRRVQAVVRRQPRVAGLGADPQLGIGPRPAAEPPARQPAKREHAGRTSVRRGAAHQRRLFAALLVPAQRLGRGHRQLAEPGRRRQRAQLQAARGRRAGRRRHPRRRRLARRHGAGLPGQHHLAGQPQCPRQGRQLQRLAVRRQVVRAARRLGLEPDGGRGLQLAPDRQPPRPDAGRPEPGAQDQVRRQHHADLRRAGLRHSGVAASHGRTVRRRRLDQAAHGRLLGERRIGGAVGGQRQQRRHHHHRGPARQAGHRDRRRPRAPARLARLAPRDGRCRSRAHHGLQLGRPSRWPARRWRATPPSPNWAPRSRSRRTPRSGWATRASSAMAAARTPAS